MTSPFMNIKCSYNNNFFCLSRYNYYYSLSSSLPLPPVYSGVDDILPILSYVIIRSGLPQLVAEMAIMDEFMQDGSGGEGWKKGWGEGVSRGY